MKKEIFSWLEEELEETEERERAQRRKVTNTNTESNRYSEQDVYRENWKMQED